MTFQEFCESINDGQTIKTEKAFVLSFTNSKEEEFSISPIDIRSFFRLFVDSYSNVVTVWSDIPSKKAKLENYEEKSYRAIYKYFKDHECRSISSLGSSQTKPLTRLLSKLIAHLSDQNYGSVDENSFFDPESLSKALANFDSLGPRDTPDTKIIELRKKEQFQQWLIESGKTEKTAYSYATTSINKANELLSDNNHKLNQIYSGSIFSVKEAIEFLNNLPDWLDVNEAGGGMYRAGLNQFLKFLLTKKKQSSLTKPFLLLAGISGTGKTRFVREQAMASGSLEETYALIPVRPDWHEPSDMLGYVSRIGKQPQFVATDVLKFMIKAWKTINDAGVQLEDNYATGPTLALDKIPPYWLCLDEMNLAPVEQYFADYLSILETRHWNHDGSNFSYSCDPIVKASVLSEFSDSKPDSLLRRSLGLESEANDSLWQHFCENGISLPFNLIVAGTVNMDETTHGFSRKVIDRALSLDFGEYYPNIFNEFFEPETENIILNYPRHSDGRNKAQLARTCDSDGSRSVDFLAAVNESLLGTPFQLAYRALNELLLAVITTQPQDDKVLQAVWDDFVMTKVLPRIEGDDDKLMVLNYKNSGAAENVLIALQTILAEQLGEIWEAENPDTRPDLHRNLVKDNGVKFIPCRSKEKLTWMHNRLDTATFTSFWP